MDFRILGPLEVVGEKGALALGGARQRALLALLLTHPNEVVSTDRLIDELWGDEVPERAANALQYHVSQLRKALAPADRIRTQPPGYAIEVGPDELDLLRFERLVEDAESAPPERAAELLREGLRLWRGTPLADCASESFAQTEIVRLEELRLRALELRIDADLALGRHSEVTAELEALVREHPLRERLRAALMRALYASGRQAEALEVYRQTRANLVEALGIEPSPALQELERAILRQDPALDGTGPSQAHTPERAIAVVVRDERVLDALLAIAEPLAQRAARELILVRLFSDGEGLAEATMALADRREALAARGVSARIAAYTTADPGDDAAVLAVEQNADLLLVDAAPELVQTGRLDDELAAILARVPCDVAVLADGESLRDGPVVTPFGGIEHDWSAIEIAAWMAGALGTTLRLLGREADPASGGRDASRLLARASLLVQQVVGIVTEPVLIPPGESGVVEAAADARLLVVGLSDRWRSEGLGPVRLAVAASSGVPLLFVRRGAGASGLRPQHTLTRFSWTVVKDS